jgi:hypothetical protein
MCQLTKATPMIKKKNAQGQPLVHKCYARACF